MSSSPDLTPEQEGFPRSLDEIRRPSDEEVEGIPERMREQIEEARRARLGKISHSDPEMRTTVVGPVPDQDFLKTYVGLRGLDDCVEIAREASTRLEQVGIASGVTERPLRDFLEGIRRMDDSWPEKIALLGEPAVLRSEQPTLSFHFPVPAVPGSLDIKGHGFAVEEVDSLLNSLGNKLTPEGIYVYSSYVPADQSGQNILDNLSTQRPGSVLAFALTR